MRNYIKLRIIVWIIKNTVKYIIICYLIFFFNFDIIFLYKNSKHKGNLIYNNNL